MKRLAISLILIIKRKRRLIIKIFSVTKIEFTVVALNSAPSKSCYRAFLLEKYKSVALISIWIPKAVLPADNKRRKLKLLSRDCDGCSQMKACSKRYSTVTKGEKVYCPDGTAHLVDGQ